MIGVAWIGTGLYAWWRRPGQPLRRADDRVGFAWLLHAFVARQRDRRLHDRVLCSNLYLAAFVHLLLAYPDGRVTRPVAHGRLIVVRLRARRSLGPLPALMFGFDARRRRRLPGVGDPGRPSNDTLGNVARRAVNAARGRRRRSTSSGSWCERWREATPPQRRAMAPLLWSGFALLVLRRRHVQRARSLTGMGALTDVLALASLSSSRPSRSRSCSGCCAAAWSAATPWRSCCARLGEAPGTDGLRGLLADALDDPLAQAHLLDRRPLGRPRRASRPSCRRPATPRARGRRSSSRASASARSCTTRALAEKPELVSSVAAAAGLAMQNERLEAALRARLEELQPLARPDRRGRPGRAPAARAQPARRRPAAPGRAVADAAARPGQAPQGRPTRAEELLAGAQEELGTALDELRELARGIHPAVLSDRGLQARRSRRSPGARRSPVRARRGARASGCPRPVEAAAYFVVAEALTNVAKYADASAGHGGRARAPTATPWSRCATTASGGADPGRGSGLRGLADRVGALDGALELDSPPGQALSSAPRSLYECS